MALYRKYRPANFAEVIGQDHIVTAIKGALEAGKVSHAYLLCGPRGTGKTTIARTLVAILNGDKFEILVKPDPALEYKTGKRTDFSSLLVSDEIYSDANKGSRASGEKLTKHFKTKDTGEIAKQILTRGELACSIIEL